MTLCKHKLGTENLLKKAEEMLLVLWHLKFVFKPFYQLMVALENSTAAMIRCGVVLSIILCILYYLFRRHHRLMWRPLLTCTNCRWRFFSPLKACMCVVDGGGGNRVDR